MSDPPEAKKPRLANDDYEKLKHKLRERKKKLGLIPRIRLLAVGESASLNLNANEVNRIPIFLSDIQHLLLYSMLGHHSPYVPDRWCKLDKYNKISHTVVFVIEGLSINHFLLNEPVFHTLTTKLQHRLELVTPTTYGGSVIDELAAVPLTQSQKAHLIKKFGSLEDANRNNGDVIKLFRKIFPFQPVTKINANQTKNTQLPSTDKFSRLNLILSPWQLVEENYPIPLKGGLSKRYSNYVLTKDEYTEVSSNSPLYSLDCEMCKTAVGVLELARISIVDEKLNTIYDTLVKPDNKIIDYLTRFSGITEGLLEGVKTKLSDVQKFIRAFLPPNAIIVGQSLNSDMHALKMMHPYIIDTSVIFNLTGDRFRKTKLKHLASAFLNEDIQNSKKGHCSIEDSQASMKLVKLKLTNSLHFGDSVLSDRFCYESYESKYKKNNQVLNMKQEQGCTLGSVIFNHVAKIEAKTSAIYGNSKTMNDYSKILKNCTLSIMGDQEFEKGDNVRLVIAESNKDIVTRCSELSMEHSLNFCHVTLDEEQLSKNNLNETLRCIDEWVTKLWKHAALHGLICVIFSGEKDASNGACFLNIKKSTDIEMIDSESF